MGIKKEYLVFGILVIIFFAVVGYDFFFFDAHMDHHRAMHSYMSGRVGPSLLGFNLLFWILIFALAYLLLKDRSKGDYWNGAIMVLKERYARGEITKDEYLEMFRVLKEG